MSTAGPAITAPVWVRLVRSGDVISAFYRRFTTFDDNPNQGWTLIGRQQFTGLPLRLSAMLVSSSHVDGTLATGNFESIRVDRTEVMQSIDIGATTAGRTGTDGTTLTMEGDGADIWGTADAFRFHYAYWTGDGEIIARVRSLENTNAWAKAGVMIRESLTANSKHAMVIVSSSKGIAMQYRGVTGGSSLEAVRTLGAAPKWLRLERIGNVISAYVSDGEATSFSHFYVWEQIGEVTLPMGADIYVGLAVTSHSPGTLATAVFDDVIVQR